MTTGAGGKSYFFSTGKTSKVKSYQVLDVQAVKIDGDDLAVKTYSLTEPAIQSTDLLICGGGMGAVAAAYTALLLDHHIQVVLTEETSWIGGQMTSQGVSALDENKWVESTGAASSYLQMRDTIRAHYQSLPDIKSEAKNNALLNPGLCWVTRLSFEPKLGLKTLEDMLAGYVEQGRLKIVTRTKAVDCHTTSSGKGSTADSIAAVLFVNQDNGQFVEYQSASVIDATELGDILALAKVPYHTGSDDKSRTGEAHAPQSGNPDNVQDFTYPFVLTYHPGQNHTIAKPAGYDEFNNAGKFSLFGFKMFEDYDGTCPVTGKAKHFLPFWTYRRLIASELFDSSYPLDLSMINWDANDLRGHNIIDVTATEASAALRLAKQVSMGFVYWLQTEAPRDDGGKGYAELKLDYELMGSADGLSLYPYIREARRLSATTTVVEEDIVVGKNPQARAAHFPDSIGIGHYPVDIHGLQEVPDTAQETKPFQIPYGALITASCANLMAGCKNIGVTHITNGAYRLHPIEWAIGTACGAAATIALEHKLAVNNLSSKLLELQYKLAKAGSPLMWFDDVSPKDQAFAAIQLLTLLDILPYDREQLSFGPANNYDSAALTQIVDRLQVVSAETAKSVDVNALKDKTRAAIAQDLLTQLLKDKTSLTAV